MEVYFGKLKLKPGSIPRVREWVSYFEKNSSEIYSLLRNEGVWIESVFLDTVDGNDYLLYYMKAECVKAAQEIFLKSESPHDQYHLEFLRAVVDSSSKPELLIDMDRIGDPPRGKSLL